MAAPLLAPVFTSLGGTALEQLLSGGKKKKKGFFESPSVQGGLVKGGFDLAGGLISGIGAQREADRQERLRQQQELLDVEREERFRGQELGFKQRAQDLQGLEFLGQQRFAATNQDRRRKAIKGFLGAF